MDDDPERRQAHAVGHTRALMSATEYRRHAEDCLRLAEGVSPETRVVLMLLAQAWLRLAQQRERREIDPEAAPVM